MPAPAGFERETSPAGFEPVDAPAGFELERTPTPASRPLPTPTPTPTARAPEPGIGAPPAAEQRGARFGDALIEPATELFRQSFGRQGPMIVQQAQLGSARFYDFLDRMAGLVARPLIAAGVPPELAHSRAFERTAARLRAGVGQPIEPGNFIEQVVADVTQAITGDLPAVGLATAVGGPVGGFAGLEALEALAAGGGPKEVALGIAAGGLTGGAFKALGPLTRAPRAAGMGVLGAAQAARGTTDPRELSRSAATLAILGQLGGRGQLTTRQALRDVRRGAGPIREPVPMPGTRAPQAPAGFEPETRPPAGFEPEARRPAVTEVPVERPGVIPGIGALGPFGEPVTPVAPEVSRPSVPQAPAEFALGRIPKGRSLAIKLKDGAILDAPGIEKITVPELLQAHDVAASEIATVGHAKQGLDFKPFAQLPTAPPAPPPEAPRMAPEGPAAVAEATGPRARGERWVGKATEIALDPERFQFKRDVDVRGMGAEMRAAAVFNPRLAKDLTLWRDPADGKLYVVNGHNRVGKALEANYQGNLEGDILDPKTYPTVASARFAGAVENIAENRGTPLDAAKVFRDGKVTPAMLEELGISLEAANARAGLGIAALDESVFRKVVTGELSEKQGAIIGRELPDHAMQRAVLPDLAEPLSDAQLRMLLRQAELGPVVEGTQQTLFGAETRRESLAVPRAKVASYIDEALAREKRTFGVVGKEPAAELLRTAGNVIQTAASQQRALGAAQLREVYQRELRHPGPVNDLLSDAARRIARGEDPNAVHPETYRAVLDVLRTTPGISEGGALQVGRQGPGEAGPAQGGLFGRRPAPVEAVAPAEEARLASRVDQALTAIEQEKERGSFSRRQRPPEAPDTVHGTVAFENPETEARFQQAKQGVQRPNLRERLREITETIWRKTMRGAHEFLPRGAGHAELRQRLLLLAKAKRIAGDRTIRILRNLTFEFGPRRFDLFTRKVLLDDLQPEAEAGRDLPFGFTPESVATEHPKITRLVEANPKIAESVAGRKAIRESLLQDYVQAMSDIGLNVASRMTHPDYYRHQVLEHARLRSLVGTGQRLRTPAGRSFLKRRAGSTSDINANYIEAEFEVMAQMFHDIETAKVIKFVDDHYNRVAERKGEARRANEQAIITHFQELADQQPMMLPEGEGPRLTGEQLYRRTLNWTQAKAIGDLGKLAAEGELPRPPDGRFDYVVEELRDVYEQTQALKEDMGEDFTSDQAPRISNEVFPDLIHMMSWLLKEHGGETGSGPAAAWFKGIRRKQKYIAETLTSLGQYKTWEDFVSSEEAVWQPREGNIFYLADTVPERIARGLLEGTLQSYDLTAADLGKVTAIGGPRKQLVIPKDVVAQLEDLVRPPQQGLIEQVNRAGINAWKRWQLVSPRRFFKYQVRNLTGDADGVFAGNPAAFRWARLATRELYPAFFKTKELSGEVAKWYKRGGFESTLQAQEITDLKDLTVFRHLFERSQESLPVHAFRAYWRGARLATDYRESILRYAAYRSYLDDILRTGKPRNYGASIREEIDAIPDPRDKAFTLSNELLGAYDDISPAGQVTRRHLIPFWSWKEINLRRYVQLFRNATLDAKTTTQLLKKAGLPAAMATTRGGIRMASFMLKASALWAAMQAYNNLRYPEEERELDEYQRNRPHLILGREADGSVRYFSNLGALGDFLSWFGLDVAPQLVDDWFRGRRTALEIAQTMAKSPINLIVQGLGPTLKTPAEIAARQTFFPDVFTPRTIRDRGHYLFRSIALGDEYAAIFGKPSRGYLDSLKDLFYYRIDPGQGAYRDILDVKQRFLRRHGRSYAGFADSPRGEALYHFKLSLRYKDGELAKKYLGRYVAAGGTPQGLTTSLRLMHPLAGLNEVERLAFVAGLDADDRRRLGNAERFYVTTLLGGR